MLSTPPGGNLEGRTRRRGDAIFRMLAQGSGAALLVIMAAIAVFLVLQAVPALNADTTSFLTTSEMGARRYTIVLRYRGPSFR